MRKILVITVLVALCSATPPGMADEGSGHQVNAEALATIRFPFTGSDTQRAYLGIPTGETLSLNEIKAENLLIVVFNAFCTICQADAPFLNAMYQMVEEDLALKGRTKVLGIATGNTAMEVEDFRQKYQVPFPLVSDPDFALSKAMPENLRTPMLVTTRANKSTGLQVIATHFGAVEDPGQLLGQRLRSAMLDTGSYSDKP